MSEHNPEKQVVTDYWHKFFIKEGLCSLCGNVGIIDTRATARSPAGFYCGDVHFCICPNGQQWREMAIEPAQQALESYIRMYNVDILMGRRTP